MSQPVRIRPYEAPEANEIQGIYIFHAILNMTLPGYSVSIDDAEDEEKVANAALRALDTAVRTFRQTADQFFPQPNQGQAQDSQRFTEDEQYNMILATRNIQGTPTPVLTEKGMCIYAWCRELLINHCLIRRVVPGLYHDHLCSLTGTALASHVDFVASRGAAATRRDRLSSAKRQAQRALEVFWGDRRSDFQLDVRPRHPILFGQFPDSACVPNGTERLGWDDALDAKIARFAQSMGADARRVRDLF
ncbi:hypothetical protein F4810DRAFT_572771 [Camillea tinctor]|nr:hypothetical protein F4810DRAFT_572771 [Camillea tinctor]